MLAYQDDDLFRSVKMSPIPMGTKRNLSDEELDGSESKRPCTEELNVLRKQVDILFSDLTSK